MDKKDSLKEELVCMLNREQEVNKNRAEIVDKYKIVMETPLEKLISDHILYGYEWIRVDGENIIKLDTELLIRLLREISKK